MSSYFALELNNKKFNLLNKILKADNVISIMIIAYVDIWV